MQTRRSFLSHVIGFGAFLGGGALAIYTRENFKEATRNHNSTGNILQPGNNPPDENVQKALEKEKENTALIPKRFTDKLNLPVITSDHGVDFVIGGSAGLLLATVIRDTFIINRFNKALSGVVKRLTQLEGKDLSEIKNTLEQFARKENIHCRVNENANIEESIRALLDAIILHVDLKNQSVKGFVEELQMLRESLVKPFSESLNASADEIKLASKQTMVEVLRGEKLKTYLENVVVKALDEEGVGEEIGQDIVRSFEGNDLVTEKAHDAFKQNIAEVLQGAKISEKLNDILSNAFDDSALGEKLVEAIVGKITSPTIKYNEQSLTKLQETVNGVLTSVLNDTNIGDKLSDAIYNAISESSIAENLVSTLEKRLTDVEIKDDDSTLVTLTSVLNNALERDNVAEKLSEDLYEAVAGAHIAENLVEALEEKLKNEAIQPNDPALLSVKSTLKDALESDDVTKKLNDAISEVVGESNLAKTFIENLRKALSTKA